MAKIKKHTNTLVSGGGLSGLIIAAGLEKAGVEYTLVDSGVWGGNIRPQNENGALLDYGLKSSPIAGTLESHSLSMLKEFFNLKFELAINSDRPMTLSKTGLVEFTGFGDSTQLEIISALEFYTQTPRLLIQGGFKNLVDELLAIVPESKRFEKSQVTKLEVDTDGSITSVLINGSQSIAVERVLWCAQPTELLKVLAQPDSKSTNRIKKTHPLSCISLDIITREKVFDSGATLVLRDTGVEEFNMVGQFVSISDPLRLAYPKQLSSWLTIVGSDSLDEDGEFGAKLIRNMKRLIKKAAPTLPDLMEWERILVAPQSHNVFEQLKLEHGRFPGTKNLFVAGGQLRKPFGVDSAIQSAMEIIDLVTEVGSPEEFSAKTPSELSI